MIHLARATSTDIEGIATVVHDAWEQEILPAVATAQIQDDACALWVARKGDDVLGFVSAFLTVDGTDRRRWEIDLLAVRGADQGQGLGQELIRRACEDAERQGITPARAVIRIDNVPSQRAFEKAGFSTDGEVHRLFLWTPQLGDVPDPLITTASLLPVDTLTYRGLWIEELVGLSHTEQRTVVKTARAMIARENRLNTGALIAADKEHLLAPDLRNQAKTHGDYYCFIKPHSMASGVAD